MVKASLWVLQKYTTTLGQMTIIIYNWQSDMCMLQRTDNLMHRVLHGLEAQSQVPLSLEAPTRTCKC